jgi:hypothetical protein
MPALYQNVWSHGDYIYHTAPSGIDVYDSTASTKVSFISLASVPSSVWANDDYVFMGTTTAGIYNASVATISGSAVVTGTVYRAAPNLTADNVIYLHGAGDYLCASTESGVDRYSIASGTRIYTEDADIKKCYQIPDGTLYYIESSAFVNVDENEFGGAVRDWTYYQYITFSSTYVDDCQVYVDIQADFPYDKCNSDGSDIRFISESGEVLSYYIESWYPTGRIVVKVPDSGTTSFYMLYGNENAASQSDPEGAYILYDHFDGTTLDTNKWVANTRGDGTVSVSNSRVTIRDNDNDSCEIITKSKVPYGYTKAALRYNGGSSITDFDGAYGYSLTNTGFSGRGYVIICPTHSPGDPQYENAHYLVSYWGGSVQGARVLTAGFGVWEFKFIDGFQTSTFDGETLTTSGTGIDNENYLGFRIHNNSSYPDLQIDYVIHTHYPFIETTTSTEQNLWPFIKPKLHAVYEPTTNWSGADYTYDSFYGNPLYINDIHTTPGTSTTSGNTLFLATDRGVHIIDERQGNETNANVKRYYIS